MVLVLSSRAIFAVPLCLLGIMGLVVLIRVVLKMKASKKGLELVDGECSSGHTGSPTDHHIPTSYPQTNSLATYTTSVEPYTHRQDSLPN